MFPETQWNLLAAATLNGDPAGRAALALLCESYRGPVVAYLRSQGLRPEEVDDIAQDFFVQLMESRTWRLADRERGRFRAFLLGVLNRMLAGRQRMLSRFKRGGDQVHESLDEPGAEVLDKVPVASNEQVTEFDRIWAFSLASQAIERVRHDYIQAGRTCQFEILRQLLPGATRAVDTAAIAVELGISLDAARAAIFRFRNQFRDYLRASVARTVSAPHEVDDELRYLARLLMTEPRHVHV
jgi:DNA-directed RNA polymerase specialized sigma24 family protein